MSASVVLLARSASTTTRPPRRLLSLRRGCCIGLDVDPRHPREDAFDGRGGWVRGDRRTRHTRHTRWGRQPAGVSSSGREEATTSVEDLTRPGLTPWQVLGIDEDDVAVVTLAEVKAAFRARMKVYHPDVYRGDGDGEAMARRIVAAYRAVMEVEGSSGDAATMAEWDGVNDVFPWARPGADPFEDPEGPADDVFVNAFECRGRGRCPSYCCCVDRNPRSFAWDEDTNAARFNGQTWTELTRRQRGDSSGSDDAKAAEAEAYTLNLAVGQCPTSAIHWVTPRQRALLDEIVADAARGVADPRDASYVVYERLAKAAFENKRAAAPARKRTPNRSTEWVDWY